MKYLIDTNVISELVSAKPCLSVQEWIKNVPAEAVYLSVLTFGEIRKGIEKLDHSSRKNQLLIWLEHDLVNMFHSRILPVSIEVAERWGRLTGQAKRTIPAIDGLIAATALHHDMTLVTRNTEDFTMHPGLEVINPWL